MKIQARIFIKASAILAGAALVFLSPSLSAAEDVSPEPWSAACPAGQHWLSTAEVRPTTAVTETADASGWQTLPVFVEGKRGSLIHVRYSFNISQVAPHQWVTLKMRFDQVQSQPALAYVYPLDGTKLSGDRQRIYFSLMSNQHSEAQLALRAPHRGGGLAIVTCQNGRATIYSVDLPGRTQTRDKSTGALEFDDSGNPIVRILLDK